MNSSVDHVPVHESATDQSAAKQPPDPSRADCESLVGLDSLDLELINAREVETSAALASSWTQLRSRFGDANSLYSSRDWFLHLAKGQRKEVSLAVFKTGSGQIAFLLPMLRSDYELDFGVASRVLFAKHLPAQKALGSGFLGPSELQPLQHCLQLLIDTIGRRTVLVFPTVPKESPTWKALETLPRQTALRSRIVRGHRTWSLLALAPTLDEYLAEFSWKSRGSLRRLKRRFEKRLDNVELRRFSRADEVDEFLAAVRTIEQQTWQKKLLGDRLAYLTEGHASYLDLASRGLSRSYVLYGDGRPLAFVIGYQKDATYCLAETGYDASVANLSPGKVLMLGMIEDLTLSDSPDTVNFGMGEAPYKKHFANIDAVDACWIVHRQSPWLSAWFGSHSSFESTVDKTKAALSGLRSWLSAGVVGAILEKTLEL